MSDETAKGSSPGYWIYAGAFIVVLDLILKGTGNVDSGVVLVVLLAGLAMIVFGVLAKAIQLGVRSARDD